MKTVAKIVVLDKDVEGEHLKVTVSIQEGKVTLGDDLIVLHPDGDIRKRIQKILCNDNKRTSVWASENVECEFYLIKSGASRIKKGDLISVGEGLLPQSHTTTQFRIARSPE